MKKYIIIQSNGCMEERAIYLLGVTSKTSDVKQKGMFGTGLKYGLTSVLREGIGIAITAGKNLITFETKEELFREVKYNQIYVNVNGESKETGMVVEMGQLSWKLEQGLKELVSNAMDEGGFKWYEGDRIVPSENHTKIYIENTPDIKRFFDNIEKYFIIKRKPIFKSDDIDIYETSSSSTKVYRREVLVYEGHMPAVFDYDLKNVPVREDRTSDSYDVRNELRRRMNSIPNKLKKRLLDELSLAVKKDIRMFESEITIDWETPSPGWKRVLGDAIVVDNATALALGDRLFSYSVKILPLNWVSFLKRDEKINTGIKMLGESTLKGWEEKTLFPYEEDIISQVVEFLTDIGYQVSKDMIVIANNHKTPDILGQLVDGKYYINSSAMQQGFDMVLRATVEEMFHDSSKQYDETREFQNYCIDQCVYNMKKLRSYVKKYEK